MVNAADDFTKPPCRKQAEKLIPAAQKADVVDTTSVQHASGSEDEDNDLGNEGN
jgi:hypothetical protein